MFPVAKILVIGSLFSYVTVPLIICPSLLYFFSVPVKVALLYQISKYLSFNKK